MQEYKIAFHEWLHDKDTKKYNTIDCINCIEKTSDYAIKNHFTPISFWLLSSYKTFNDIKSQLLNNRKYRYFINTDFNLFLIAGSLYSKFLKYEVPNLENKIQEQKQNAIIESSQIRKRTIAEAVVEVLKQKQPLFVRDIYQEIIYQGLYVFNATQPINVLFNTIIRQCMGVNVSKQLEKKLFKVIIENGKNKYALIDYNDSELNASENVFAVIPLDWDDQIAFNFQNWIIQQGKAETTAKSYRSAMNYIVKTFSKEWVIAKNRPEARIGLNHFYNLIKVNENFIASNSIMHNAYNASIKAFYAYLNNQFDLKVQGSQNTAGADKIWDWKGENDYTDTKPVKVIIKTGEEVLVKSWKDVFRYIYEYAIDKHPSVDIIGQHISSEKMLSPYKLKNGHFIETQYSTKQIMAKCKHILTFCGENLFDIKVVFKKKSEQQSSKGSDDINVVQSAIPDSVIQMLRMNYPNGFKFDATAIRLLEDRIGIKIDAAIQKSMKKNMFHRGDDLYFLLESITTDETLERIKKKAYEYLSEFKAFELSVLYSSFENCIAKDCIRDVDDFEKFYEFIFGESTRCFSKYSTRIARLQNEKVDNVIDVIVKNVYSIIYEGDGVAHGWMIAEKLSAFSESFIANIIKEHAEDIIKTKIGDIAGYRTLDMLNLPEDFSDRLSRILERIKDLKIEPTEYVLHSLLSFEIGVNFKEEYDILENKTFRRLIALYYKDSPKREWKSGIFTEVSD